MTEGQFCRSSFPKCELPRTLRFIFKLAETALHCSMQNSDSWEMNVTWMSQLERIHRILVSGNLLEMGGSSGNYLFFSLTPESAGTCLFWVSCKLHPAKIETKTMNGKSLKFHIPAVYF